MRKVAERLHFHAVRCQQGATGVTADIGTSWVLYLMAVHDRYLFAYEDAAQEREQSVQRREGTLLVERDARNVVDLRYNPRAEACDARAVLHRQPPIVRCRTFNPFVRYLTPLLSP